MVANFHIPPLSPEPLFEIGNVVITNTIVNAWIAIIIFFVLGVLIYRNVKLKPGKLQNAAEFIIELVLPYFDQVTGDRKKTIKFLPIVGSIFFFVLLSNWLGLLPGTGSILFGHNPLLRPIGTDLNITLAMALVAVISSHIYGFIAIGVFAHIGKFIQIKGLISSIKKGPIAIFTAFIEMFVGLLEIISEVAKVLSLSLRLFGNVLAGEILLSVMAGLVAALVPVPFMLLELLVGLIQATVFAMLTLVYLEVATNVPHGEH
ncbi:F0F1 ATP synthase subunit A [Patescibacteria group bacterium]|nr:F0F1 ATP synthase subunit A [Patescibacteria group bacterium]